MRGFLRRGALLLLLGAAWLLLVAPAGPPAYDRALWGGWTTEDCRDTRTRVLLRDAEPGSVEWRDAGRCEIAHGRWTDPWTGARVSDPGRLDIDHHVPLKNAHESGGAAWSRARKQVYANELGFRGHLRATLASANREKGDGGPDRWRPPTRESWCEYALNFGAIKFRWGLTGSEAERLAVGEMLKTCGDPTVKTLLDR